MNLMEVIRQRRSIRVFKRDPIPLGHIESIKESLIWAPSAGNLQSRVFFFVSSGEVKSMLARAAYHQDFIKEAPLAVVCCANKSITRHYGARGENLYAIQDVAASVQNMLLLAHSLGLGTVWVGAFDEEEVSRILELPPHLRPVAIVPVGYAGESPLPPERVPIEEAIVPVQ